MLSTRINIEVSKFNSNFRANELRAFDYDLRNKIRAIAFSDVDDAILLLNKLRAKIKISDLVKLESFLRSIKLRDYSYLISPLYPNYPQTYNNFIRLKELKLDDQLYYMEKLLILECEKINDFISDILDLNRSILKIREDADDKIGEIFKKYGYSHFILRKAIVIKICGKNNKIDSVDNLINNCGYKDNNVVISSLIQCYQLEQDYISLKKSVMNFPDKKMANKYIRDIIRIPFNPIAKDENDFNSLILSCLQSSFIDALFFIFINRRFVDLKYKKLHDFFNKIKNIFSSDIEISEYYLSLDESSVIEDIFYQQSSAWMEYDFINDYRLLPDNFYDDPDANYININNDLVDAIRKNNSIVTLSNLYNCKNLRNHKYENLKIIENSGSITRSSLFNFLLYENKGNYYLDEESLYNLMGVTKDLSRTIDVNSIRNLAAFTESLESKIIYYLLIFKKSKNESDDYDLRRLMQTVVKTKHDKSLVNYIKDTHIKSKTIAYYIYEVCTEDFIAKLSHIITSISQITETRANLHKWMGEVTGEKSYLDRARTILIDQQINKVRDELDDHRIYVDSAKFIEWINDDLMRDINSVLSGITYNLQSENTEIPLLYSIIEKAFFEFTSNKVYGIASYLGRRIRHGTFKGHLTSVTKTIETDFHYFLLDPVVSIQWGMWKESYEKNIDLIIRHNLHIETITKRDGILKPNLKGNDKSDIALACTKDILHDFKNNNATSVISILVDYCWRLIEVDLRQINSFLNARKSILINNEKLLEIREVCKSNTSSKELIREIQHLVSEKVNMMSSWFKRPQSVAPKASLSLLYKAVIAEVQVSFPHFLPEIDFGDEEIELMGGAYHVLYDAFYVVIYNAAKHGKHNGSVIREFKIIKNNSSAAVNVTITSEISDEHSNEYVDSRLKISANDDISNAQLVEDRSGIKKLYNLQVTDPNFYIDIIKCINRKVIISMSYGLVHI